jgi:hypothetical protein
MLTRKEIEKEIYDIFSFFGKYIILVFNDKKQYKYINENSYSKILVHIATFVVTVTAIVYLIAKIYSTTKPLPIIYLPIHIIIFSILYLFPNSYMYIKGKTKSEMLEYIKQAIFSTIIIVSFSSTLVIIMYSLFIVTESYFVYYLMVSIIVLLNIYFAPIRLVINSGSLKKNLLISRLFFIVFFIFCVMNLVFLNQFSFIYKGKTFVYSFDPIYQEMLDNMKDRQDILEYISDNNELMTKVLSRVVFEKEFEMYDLLIQQINTISNKEIDINNIFNNLVFEKNKRIYKYILSYISTTKYIKIELERLQFITDVEIDDIILEIENDINNFTKNIEELEEIYSYINLHVPEPNEFEYIMNRVNKIRKEGENFNTRRNKQNYVLSQAKINFLVMSEIHNLSSKRLNIMKYILDEMNREEKIMKTKLRWSWLLNGI